ncbi:MAG: hypothetical protein J5842_07955, partial [Lachnospiraceae bacterium]|nr:hypothetical protein [Lachnospiraceae bacterium]
FNMLTGGSESKRYWFADPTVCIRTELGDPDNSKNEFPSYSVALGDLHAHVINLIFVLPLLAMLFEYCLSDDKNGRREMAGRIYRLTLISILLGYYKGSNYWDYGIYFVITGAVILFCDIRKGGIKRKTFGMFALKAVFVTAVSFVTPILFTKNFAKMVTGFELCEVHSPFLKYLILWLAPILITAGLLIYLYSKRQREAGFNKVCREGFLALIICTTGLIITPEIIYIKDIYEADNHRFNTIFKLTYQAFILFAVIAGVALAAALFEMTRREKIKKTAAAAACALALLVLLSASYTGYATRQRFGNITDAGRRKGISALSTLRDDPEYRFEIAANDVLEQDAGKVIHIVEMAGWDYTHDNALSVYSGACTPMGWMTHEWLWRNDREIVRDRSGDVRSFYTCGDPDYCREFLKKYDIDYIFVGPAEVCSYPVQTGGFIELGEPRIYAIWEDTLLILLKVDKSNL